MPRRGCPKILSICVVAVLIVAMGTGSLAYAGELEELELKLQELTEIQKEIEAYEKSLKTTKQQQSSVTAEIRRLQQQVDLAERELRFAESQSGVLQKRIKETEAALKQTEAKIKDRTEIFNKRLVALYDIGPSGYLEVILGAGSFADFISRLDMLQAIFSLDFGLLKEMSATRAQYDEARVKLESQAQQMASLKNAQEAKRTQLTSRTQDRTRYLSQINTQVKQMEAALDELEQTSKELEGVIRDLQDKGKVNVQPGGFKPTWPVSGRVTSEFGRRLHPVTRTYRNHTGIDIAVATGTPVKASEGGLVISSGWLGGYGYTVIIDHGGGIATLYGHNSRLLVKVGQTVTKGQAIANAGSTGVSTGPHVHFEVRVKGTPVNPRNYLK